MREYMFVCCGCVCCNGLSRIPVICNMASCIMSFVDICKIKTWTYESIGQSFYDYLRQTYILTV